MAASDSAPAAPRWRWDEILGGGRRLPRAQRVRLRAPASGDAVFAVVRCRTAGLRGVWVRCTVRHGETLLGEARVGLLPWRRHVFAVALPHPLPADTPVDVALEAEPAPGWQQRLYPTAVVLDDVALVGRPATPAQVAIVVLNWKRAAETIRCVESLQRADLQGARIILVDNGSGDDSAAQLRARFPDLALVTLAENRGYAGGNNAGIRAALAGGAHAVVLLNNDTVVAPDFLPPLLWALNADPRVAAVTSVIMRMDRPELLESAWLEIYWGHGIVRHFGVNALAGEGFDQRREVGVAVGCCVLLSAAALEEVGLLDEDYFAYHEEVDWCARAHRAGWRVIYEPLSRVWHDRSKSTGELSAPLTAVRELAVGPQLPNPVPLTWNPVKVYLGARNAVRFVRRNGRWWQRAWFWLHSAYAVPLEALAVVLRQEPALKIGAWSYRRALAFHCSGHGARPVPPWWRQALALPGWLAVALPREVRIAYREGRLREIVEHLRGLRDGFWERPLPLERLKLR